MNEINRGSIHCCEIQLHPTLPPWVSFESRLELDGKRIRFRMSGITVSGLVEVRRTSQKDIIGHAYKIEEAYVISDERE